MVTSLLFASALLNLCQDADLLRSFGLKPNQQIVAIDGIATIEGGGTVQLVGVSNLREPSQGVWSSDGKVITGSQANVFWQIMDLSVDARELYSKDKEGRTFAFAFRLTPSLTKALDVREDELKTFRPLMAQSRTFSSDSTNYIGESRIIGPMKNESSIDYRLEFPGGDWTTLIEFPITGESNEKGIEVIKRWKNDAIFVNVNGEEEVVRTRVHFFTVTLPAALRNLDLEIVSNDPPEDSKTLGSLAPQHILGEDQGKEFAGKNLFIVPCLNKLDFDRKFTLRARPKRIVEFKAIPLKR